MKIVEFSEFFFVLLCIINIYFFNGLYIYIYIHIYEDRYIEKTKTNTLPVILNIR